MAEKRSRSRASNVEEPSPHFPHRPDRNIALTGIYPPIPLAEQKAAQEGKQLVSEGWGKNYVCRVMCRAASTTDVRICREGDGQERGTSCSERGHEILSR